MEVIVRSVLAGMLVMLAGTVPRNLAFAANLKYFTSVPWAVPVVAVYLWLFWRYLNGAGPPAATVEERRSSLRANRAPAPVWTWALLAGGLGIVALVLALRVANRLVALPEQHIPDLSQVPSLTLVSLLLLSAPAAGIIEEAAFRGYMQGPIERRHGLPVAILITGTMFAVAHLDFTPVLWPYYVAVAAIYGTVTCYARSILPAVLLHTSANLYSNFDLWLHGQAEWQAAAGGSEQIWTTGTDASFWISSVAFVGIGAAAAWACTRLARAGRETLARAGSVTL